MAEKKKISKNQIDKNPTLFGVPGDPKVLDIDPTEIRFMNVTSPNNFALGYGAGWGDDPGDGIGDPPSLAKLLPQLSDISIYQETIDNSTTPATVKLVLRIRNSTGYNVLGIRGRRPPA